MISPDKCNRSCNAISDLSTCVLSKTKNANVKVFNMKTRKNEAKILIFYVISNVNSIVQYVNPIKNRIIICNYVRNR